MVLIKSIKLRNILCHENLHVDFSQNITIITGPNGSGKSAIMVAIGFVLGIKRTVHQRGRTISDLLKTNTSTGFIRLKLINDTFRREFFQDFIIIERMLSVKTSKLKIMNEKNQVWSTRVEDLYKLVDHFGLHFDNPLNYLTQDMAKIFLCASKEEDLYELFLKGTEIKDLRKLHDETKLKSEEIRSSMEDLAKRMERIDNSIAINRDRSKVLDSVDEIEKRLACLENELKWSRLDYDGLKLLEKDVGSLNLKITELVGEKNALTSELTTLNLELDKENKLIEKEHREQLKVRLSVQKELEGLTLERREVENELNDIQLRIEKIQKNMHQLLNESETDYEVIINDLKEKIEITKKEKTEFEVELESIYQKNKEEEEKRKQFEKQMATTKRMLEDAMRIKTSQLAFFGSNFDVFLSEVKLTKFKNQVIGPLASEITLKDKRWYKPVSIILGKVLNSFIIYEQSDRTLLQQIIKKHRIKGVSLLIPTTRNDLIRYEQNKNYLSVIDVINSKDTILNVLIMLTQIERIILIENRDEAIKVITSKPKNVDCAYILNGDVIRMIGGSITDFTTRTDKFYFESSGARIDEFNARIRNINNLKSKIKILDSSKVGKQVQVLETKLNKLEIELKENEIKYDAYLETQQMQEEDLDEEKLNANVNQRNELMNIINDFDQKIAEQSERLNFKHKSGSKKEKIQTKIGKIEDRLLFFNEDLFKQQKIYGRKKNELDSKQAVIHLEYEKLINVGSKIENPRDSLIIEEEILKTKAQMKIANQGLSRNELIAQLKQLNIEKKQTQDLYTQYKTRSKILSEACIKRVCKREEIMKNESIRAALDFKNYIKERDYVGELIFDHDNSKLSITMRDSKLKVESKSHKIRAGDKNTLSGGERTYAGICLLMSLWPSVYCPVKILDEFDVYMDNLNRIAAVNALINYFKNNGGQAILISPLGILDIEGVDVQVLDPPTRNTLI